jgi:hypothetical protein
MASKVDPQMFAANGRPVTLAGLLGKGGQGEVYATTCPASRYKVCVAGPRRAEMRPSVDIFVE